MIEETPQPKADKPTIKARFVEATGKDIPEDYFLYSCFEYERTQRAHPRGFPADERWPVAALPQNQVIEAETMPVLVDRLVAWYARQYPDLAAAAPLDRELLVAIIRPLVFMNQDLNELAKLKTDDIVPAFDAHAATPQPFWSALNEALAKHLSSHAKEYERYFQWCHALEVVEEFEPGSRPPVGRYAPGYRGRSMSPPRPSGQRGRPDGRGKGQSEGKGSAERGARPRGERRPESRDSGSASRPEHRERSGRSSRTEQRSPELEQQALQETSRAIEQLKAQAEMQEVPLKPANGFYRRLQHQAIAAEGYYSYSTGEGPERAVVVTKKPVATEGET